MIDSIVAALIAARDVPEEALPELAEQMVANIQPAVSRMVRESMSQLPKQRHEPSRYTLILGVLAGSALFAVALDLIGALLVMPMANPDGDSTLAALVVAPLLVVGIIALAAIVAIYHIGRPEQNRYGQ